MTVVVSLGFLATQTGKEANIRSNNKEGGRMRVEGIFPLLFLATFIFPPSTVEEKGGGRGLGNAVKRRKSVMMPLGSEKEEES